MFTANTQLQVSSTSFDALKKSFKDFVKTKTEFEDYNFEGSTISYVLDILAYDSYMKNIYTNMAVNETFIDTAQIRSNLVSNAKRLGYVPKSAVSAKAKVIINFKPVGTPGQIVIPKGTTFVAVKDGTRYTFSTAIDHNAFNDNGSYSAVVDLQEGILVNQIFTYNAATTKYVLLNPNIDISTLEVGLQETESVGSIDYYKRADDLTDITEESQIYYLQENPDEKYELYFGDDIFGKRPLEGAKIRINYITTNGEGANGIRTFSPVGYTGYDFTDPSKKFNPSSIKIVDTAQFGANKQSMDDIRFSAINSFPIQGRLVTKKDYEDFVRINFPYIQSMNVWGGEDNVPQIFGKTILSLKPYGGYALTEQKKDEIISAMKRRNVMSIEPIVIDPSFIYVVPDITITYDSTKTVNSAGKIYNNVQKALLDYETNDLSSFGRVFRYSNLIKILDKADPAILSNKTVIRYEKRVAPILDTTLTYTVAFDTAVVHPYSGYIGALSSNGFRLNTDENILYLDDDGAGNVRTYYNSGSGRKVIVDKKAGTINYATGKVILNSFHVVELEDDEKEIKLRIDPEDFDLEPVRNNIVLLATPALRIVNSVDKQITKSGILDSAGNVSPIYTSTLGN